MTRALVLNASYEPLSVVAARRALVLVLTAKADIVSAAEGQFRSERLCVPEPSVVRLRQFVKVPFRHRVALNRRAVFARDGGLCQYCGDPAESIDHIVPRSKGGTHTWENVVAACRSCNVRKRDRLLHETTMRLGTVPRAPKAYSWIAVSVGRVPEDWQPYLGAEPAMSA